MMMSPSSSSGTRESMTESTGPPALTMISTRRGVSRLATSSAMVSVRMKSPSSPWAASSASVLATERLCRATVYPLRAKLRARFAPMTARPVTPICAGMKSPSLRFCWAGRIPARRSAGHGSVTSDHFSLSGAPMARRTRPVAISCPGTTCFWPWSLGRFAVPITDRVASCPSSLAPTSRRTSSEAASSTDPSPPAR